MVQLGGMVRGVACEVLLSQLWTVISPGSTMFSLLPAVESGS